MRSAQIAAAVGGLVSVANALPKSSVSAASQINDGVILNYALTLEHLEDTFYRTGLKMFSEKDFTAAGYDAAFYNNIKEVSYDEKTHVAFLTGALKAAGVTPVQECTYNFGITTVDSFIATAAVLEGVGVSAYLGAAASIANKAYLTAAGSILTVEARHSSYLRGSGLGSSPFPQPFDAPLDFNEVYTLAAPFIKSCPKGSPSLPVKAFPSLSLKSASPIRAGQQITLTTAKKLTTTKPVYACFITVTGPICCAAHVSSNCLDIYIDVPSGVYGESYVVISTSSTSVTDENTVAGPAIVEIAGTAGTA